MAVMANCNAVSCVLPFYLLSTMRGKEISILTGEETDRMVPTLEQAVGIQSHREKLIRLVVTLLAV
jgi:hypothetical protein